MELEPPNNANNQENRNIEPRQRSQCNNFFIYIIIIYLFNSMSTNISEDSQAYNAHAFDILNKSDDGQINTENVFNVFSAYQYEGYWSINKPSQYLTKSGGKVNIVLKRYIRENEKYCTLEFYIRNGDYIDEGKATYRTMINLNNWQAKKNGSIIQANKIINSSLNYTTFSPSSFEFEIIFKSIEKRNSNNTNISLTLDSEGKTAIFSTEDQDLNIQIRVGDVEKTFLASVFFAFLLFFISFTQCSGVLSILKNIFDGGESAANYSLFTILIVTLWDATICVISFMYAFQRQENLVLFIIPAFVFCLLFTNLELRFLLRVFQTREENQNIRQAICKFNLMTYGGIILIYPTIILFNLNSLFFILICLILVPQIYLNAVNGRRPDLLSPFYGKLILVRYLFIMYIKFFPWNVFKLGPNYILMFFCFLLLIAQGALLWIQKQFGAKKILPSFLLPPIFNYGLDIDINLEEGSDHVRNGLMKDRQCSICLMSLSSDSDQVVDFNVPYKLMKAPCGHSFHGSCLVKWMQIKMECPECRSKLPAFE